MDLSTIFLLKLGTYPSLAINKKLGSVPNFILLLFLFLLLVSSSYSQENYIVDHFSKETEVDGIPKGWKVLEFKKIPHKTNYSLMESDGNYFVKAVSHNSASGLFKETPIDLKEFPKLTWKWKIENILKKADARKKSGDDYPSRIYIAFEYNPSQASLWEKTKYGAVKLAYGQYPPRAAINYILDNKLPVETTIDNAYTDRTKMVVVESGSERAGEWITEERNVYKDYKKLFGSEPPKVSFIAVMTDTDNTGETAVAYYDDIIFKKR